MNDHPDGHGRKVFRLLSQTIRRCYIYFRTDELRD